MRHVGCFKVYLQNNWGLCVVFDGEAGDLNSSLCIAFCCDVWFYLLEKNFLSGKYFVKCKTLTVQSRLGGTHGMSGWASHQCCLFPEYVGIYLEYMTQRKACFKWSKPEGIFLWFIFVMKSTQRTWRALEGIYIQWGFSLKMSSGVSIQGPECALSNLMLLSHCFYSVLGYSAAWMGQRRALAVQGCTCCLHPWGDFSGHREQEGSKAASSKIKLCDIPEHLTAWKALLCLVLPFIFLSEHLTVKALSCLKTLI